MKKHVLTTVVLLLCSVFSVAQKYTFKAACLNVDGLPPSISLVLTSITLNSDGPQEAGTTAMSKLIAQKGWDFFAVSEDFNYNDELMSALTNQYEAGTFRGKIELSNASGLKPVMQTDGLNLIWKKTMAATGEAFVEWNEKNGYTDQGSDELIKKGYRYYVMEVAPGLSVDVYILHMDAEINDADIAARESQLNQLTAAIKASNNRRPVIIMGDTNCRYTRDRLKELLIDAINDDPRFTINDPWVDQEWAGVYPEYGTDALMTDEYGAQKGEVVDKMFYINNTDADGMWLTAHTYLHDTDFTYDDGTPLSDHYPVVVTFTLENTSTQPLSGSYYLRNVASGRFLNAGGWWGTHAMTGAIGNLITLTKNADASTYTLKSTCGFITNADDDTYMDGDESRVSSGWTVEPTEGGACRLTYINSAGSRMALTEVTDPANYVYGRDYNASDDSQLWELVSREALTEDLARATADAPMDATFLIRGAGFGRNDSENTAWNGDPSIGGLDNSGEANYNASKSNNRIIIGSSDWDVNQTLSLPNGRYHLSCQAFYRDDVSGSTSELSHATLYAGAETVEVPSIHRDAQPTALSDTDVEVNGKWVPDNQNGASYYFNKGLYEIGVDVTVTDRTLTIGISKTHTKTASWTCFDNFRLTYYGPTEEENAVYDRVKAAIDDAAAKAEALTAEGRAAYDNSTVVERYENRTIVGDGSEEILYTYTALANAVKAQTGDNIDMTYAIINPSFEWGDATGWNVTYTDGTTDVGVKENTDEVYATDGCDGDYLFNIFWQGTPLTQTIAKLPNGKYRLDAKVASDGARVFLTANGSHNEGTLTTDKTVFLDASIEFEVTDGIATIGVVGGSDEASGKVFVEEGHWWYKADNFRLTLLRAAHELLLDETEEPDYAEDDYTKITVQRTISAGNWSTLVLPFAMAKPEGWEVVELKGAELDTESNCIVLQFEEAASIVAGTPYMVRTQEDVTAIVTEDAQTDWTLNNTVVDNPEIGRITFTGTYVPGTVPVGAYFVSGNKFYRATGTGNTMKGFRACVTVEDMPAEVNSLRFSVGGPATGIVGATADDGGEVIGIYGADGRRYDTLRRGLNIVRTSDGRTRKITVK